MVLRRTTGFVVGLSRLAGLDWTVPDFSMLSRRQKTLATNSRYRGSLSLLNPLIGSTAIKVGAALEVAVAVVDDGRE